jgi:hypothetical protein
MVKIASPAVNAAGAMTVKRKNPHRINTHHRSEHSKKVFKGSTSCSLIKV